MNIENSPYVLAYRQRYRNNSPVHSKYETIKDSVKTVGKEYCSESSICGLKHLVNDNTTHIERTIWVIILISAIMCSASLVWFTFSKYYKAPLVTTQMPEGVSVSTIIFPAVGICSNNRISKRAVTELANKLLKEERNKKYNKTEMMSLLFVLGQLYNLQGLNETDMRPKQLHAALGDYDVTELMRDLTPHCKDLLLRCAWNEKPENCEHLFNFRLTMNGFCCTFNYLRQSDIFEEPPRPPPQRATVTHDCHEGRAVKPDTRAWVEFETIYILHEVKKNAMSAFLKGIFINSFSSNIYQSARFYRSRNSGHRSMDMYKYGNKSTFDFDMGLKVLLKIDDSDDFYYNIPSLGSTLQFSDAYDFPDAPSGSFSMKIISPSVQMTVMVTASFTEASRDIQHVSVKLRSCLFYDESSYLPFYTHSDCMLKCRMLFLLQNCNCTPFNMPKINNGRTCDMQDIPCLAIYYAQSITVRPVVEKIPPELELEKVGGGIPCPMCYPSCSKTTYSYDFNNVVIFPKYLNNVPDEDREDWLAGANFTGASIVHVKYAKEVADCYGQNVIMKWFDLISNIGSTCGFVTGFSFVSVLEFFYFFTVKLFREVHTRRQRQRHRDVTAMQPPTPAQSKPITRYRPIYWNELGNAKNLYENHQ